MMIRQLGNSSCLFTERILIMAMKSRYRKYEEGYQQIKKTRLRCASVCKSTPGSILQMLKDLKGQNAVVSVPIGDGNGK